MNVRSLLILLFLVVCGCNQAPRGASTQVDRIKTAAPTEDAHPKELTRENSAQLIAPNLPALAAGDTTAIFISGTFIDSPVSLYLRANGLLACAKKNFMEACSLNAKGKTFVLSHKAIMTNVPPGYCPSGQTCEPFHKWTIPIAEVTLTSVDGILKSDNKATVDFSYRETPNALGKDIAAFAKAHKITCGTDYAKKWNTPRNGQVAFADYDDGWRYAGMSDAAAMRAMFGEAEMPCGL